MIILVGRKCRVNEKVYFQKRYGVFLSAYRDEMTVCLFFLQDLTTLCWRLWSAHLEEGNTGTVAMASGTNIFGFHSMKSKSF